ncbi:MAG TPA: helix-turn-helix transcriptional regulator [Phnomibacter sp.]|nr:helix-turn-helix transcriptional regulator [Phnomibacter sp.]
MENKIWRKNLKFLRKKNDKTQSDIGFALNCKQQVIGNWENGIGSPNFEQIGILTKFLGVSADDFLFTDLENVHLNENRSVEKNGENVHLNVHPNVHLTTPTGPTLAHRQAAEVPPLWAIGMLQKLEEISAELEALKKDDDNAESRVGAA